jgi:NAD(P)H dehydrogenase (quinone)
MRCLIVYCHPVETSYCAALHDRALAALQRAGHEVRDIDLYAEGFRPHLTRAERLAYHDRATNRLGVEAHVDAVLWAEALIFVYPTWWYGLPAMLKGWLDRTLLPGTAFELPPNGAGAKPLLQHIRVVVAVTSMGAPRWWMAVIGSPGRRLLMRGVRALCHWRCKTLFLAHYAIDRSTPESRSRFLAYVERRLSRLRV